MIYQSIGQLRETYGGRDASSKWFESASWISFAAINDPETADYISRRCGTTTVEIDQGQPQFSIARLFTNSLQTAHLIAHADEEGEYYGAVK
jgi:type IV secretory pathway TraG/TraD family ATPase VirD4